MKQIEEIKQRPKMQSIVFMLNECCDSFDALIEINRLYSQMIKASSEEKGRMVLSPEAIVKILGTTRDSFCIRLASLFDKRKDTYSIDKFFKGDIVDKLRDHQITVAAIMARHNNICHMGKKYIKWPDIEQIVNSNIGEMLKNIRISVLLNKC